jgi:uncharacterized protein (TIRG00374 family)
MTTQRDPPRESAIGPRTRAPWWRRRRTAIGVVFVIIVGLLIYRFSPQLAGIHATLHRLRNGDPLWLIAGLALEGISLGGYIILFRGVFSCEGVQIGWRASYEITLAGTVATKLLAAAGAGGLALTAWALRASGLSARTIAKRLVAFDVILYAVYMASLIVVGVGLWAGVFGRQEPWTLTLLPAGLAAVAVAIALSALLLPDDVERRLTELAGSSHHAKRLLSRLATVPRALHDGMQIAVEMVRSRNPALIGALVYWGFDIAVLWIGFRAFGSPPSVAVIVMAYFVGTLANLLPLPGGVGGVEGGMIGALLAFGSSGSAAVLAVLTYRAISFWLPVLPGSVAYLQLRHRVARWRKRFEEAQPRRMPVPAAPDRLR